MTIGKALESLNTEEKAICEQQETVKAEVSKEFNDICRHLNQRKVQVCAEIDGSVRDKLLKLVMQKKNIQEVYTSTAS